MIFELVGEFITCLLLFGDFMSFSLFNFHIFPNSLIAPHVHRLLSHTISVTHERMHARSHTNTHTGAQGTYNNRDVFDYHMEA